jgi:transposase
METNTGYLPLQWPAREHDAVVEINPSIWFVDRDGYRVVGRGYDTPLYRFAVEDEVVLRFVAVSLRFSGLVSQQEIAAAFGHSEETQRRWERRYEREGLEGLRSKHGTGRPQKLTGTQEVCIAKWFHEGVSNCEIARRLVVSESTIRHSLRRLGLRRKAATALIQQTLEKELDAEREGCEGRCEGAREGTLAAEVVEEDSTFAGEVDPTKVRVEDEDDEEETEGTEGVVESPIRMWISDPMDRSLDRVCAALGLINDAEPAFAEIDRLPRLGVLLAIPLLVRAGVLEVFQRVYGSIGPAFYGLRTTVVCLFLLALLRIKRPENLKEHNAQELGRLIGLDRAPEVKTLRRKLDRLASSQKGLELMRQLAQLRATSPSNSEALGTLYIDGHVKEYHGRCATGKAFISQKRLAAPGATDTWVNDLNGDPLFVVQSEVNAGLTKTLGPILEEIRKQLGPDRSITVVFDRGGFSPRLFYKLIASGYHLITYRKGHFQQPPVSSFEKRTLEIGSEVFHYELHDAPRVRVGKSGNLAGRGARYLWMRQVTRRREGHGQVAVITDRTDLPAERVLYLMFHRWRQENFFKYMKEEFELDALLKYGSEPLSETQDRPNPQLRKLDQELRSARAELKDAQ